MKTDKESTGSSVQLFEDQRIRTAWDEEAEEWLFSVVDVVAVLTEQETQRGASNYWAKLKERLKVEGANELLTNCQQLKLRAEDGKQRLTDEISRAWSDMTTREYKFASALPVRLMPLPQVVASSRISRACQV
ncbi:MAG: hypothetical protein LBL23_06235 [Coriobacteriales bacterium]|jgi:hypothetical protein|nr:hypothetical protein [Coriobacteriales bacterium]